MVCPILPKQCYTFHMSQLISPENMKNIFFAKTPTKTQSFVTLVYWTIFAH